MNRKATLALALALALAAAGSATAFAQGSDVELSTEQEKTLYTLGMLFGDNLSKFGLSEADLEFVLAGVRDRVLKRPEKVDLAQYQPKVDQYAQQKIQAMIEAEKTESAAFVAKKAQEEGAQVTDTGLVYFELVAGDGVSPKPEDTVSVHYHGTLRDGGVFDSSIQRGEPATFPLNRVIPCWTEGLQKMKAGGKSRLVCPAKIAYGDRGAGSQIMPGAALVFDVELLEVQKAPAPAPEDQ